MVIFGEYLILSELELLIREKLGTEQFFFSEDKIFNEKIRYDSTSAEILIRIMKEEPKKAVKRQAERMLYEMDYIVIAVLIKEIAQKKAMDYNMYVIEYRLKDALISIIWNIIFNSTGEDFSSLGGFST